MAKRKYESAYVPAVAPRWNLLTALWAALRMIWATQPRRQPAQPQKPVARTPKPVAHPGEFANEPGPHVWRARAAATEARRLLGFYLRGESVSRRHCMAAGMSDGAWRRARRVLQRAGVISRHDGRLLYAKRAAQLQLDVYLDGVERRCRESGRFVAP